MSSISAGTTTGTALVSTGDTTGQLVLKTNGTTTAVTIGTDQVVTLVQALPAGSGGTGLTAPGTNGNVLTSNGTAWTSAALPSGGVTSLNGQTGSITNTDLYAIGSYISGRPQDLTNYSANATVAGSTLYNVNSYDAVWNGSAWNNTAVSGAITAVLINTGTWRCMSGARAAGSALLGIWVRIS